MIYLPLCKTNKFETSIKIQISEYEQLMSIVLQIIMEFKHAILKLINSTNIQNHPFEKLPECTISRLKKKPPKNLFTILFGGWGIERKNYHN